MKKLDLPLAFIAAFLMTGLGAVGCGSDCEGLCDDVASLCERASNCPEINDPDLEAQCAAIAGQVDACRAECDSLSDEDVDALQSFVDLANRALDDIGC